MTNPLTSNPVIKNASGGNPLDQLKPIIFPDYDVSVWPLAIGWWLLLGIVVLSIGGYFILRPCLKAHREKKQLLENTLSLLDSLYTECAQQNNKPKALQHYLQKSNEIFKRIVHANEHVSPFAQLTGQHWIDFIIKADPDSHLAKYYGDHLYAAYCNEDISLENLHRWATGWVKLVDKKAKKISRESGK